MFKRILSAIFCLCLIFAVGCKNTSNTPPASSVAETASTPEGDPAQDVPSQKLTVNPLTGKADLANEAAIEQRPVAIMVNNISQAQRVQAGLSKASIIYEAEVEGGITRLLAVYQDISTLGKIGTVRSARHHFVELAQGHNAVYIHCGQNIYAEPILKTIDHLWVDNKTYGGERVANGSTSSEHTLYVNADKLLESINSNFDIKTSKNKFWASFTDDELKLSGGAANSVTVNYPTANSNFTYDSATGLYTRLSNSTKLTDYFTKEETKVKNVFILMTGKTYFQDNKTPRMTLESGEGYYITNGTYQKIKWTKGAAANGFKFTDTSGAELKVSAGNSWVCIANKATCTPTFK